jgi:pimeloyl-ACP methyl ester carboxylesterase
MILLASPLVLAKTYRATTEALGRRNRVFAVELPGSGRADRLGKPWELSDYAAWTAGFIEALDLEDATLIGHSHSGGIALMLPVLHPGRVARLVIAGGIGAGDPPTWTQAIFGRLLDISRGEARLAAHAWHHVVFNSLAHTRNFFHQSRVSVGCNLLLYADRVDVPVLLAWGRRDHTIPPSAAKRLARHLPDAKTYECQTGTHAWPITHADEFAQVVTAWREELRAPRLRTADTAITQQASDFALVAGQGH